MVLHVKDAETSELVRELAKRRGIGITAAIKEAASEALDADRKGFRRNRHLPLEERLKPFFERIDRLPNSQVDSSRTHSDDLWGQED